jgi:hypothetical protein
VPRPVPLPSGPHVAVGGVTHQVLWLGRQARAAGSSCWGAEQAPPLLSSPLHRQWQCSGALIKVLINKAVLEQGILMITSSQARPTADRCQCVIRLVFVGKHHPFRCLVVRQNCSSETEGVAAAPFRGGWEGDPCSCGCQPASQSVSQCQSHACAWAPLARANGPSRRRTRRR